MNERILHTDVQLFLQKNANSDAGKLSLSKSPFSEVSASELAAQIVSRKKAEKKLPTWHQNRGIYYPAALSIEQTSSEVTAAFKASLFSGDSFLDITAGFGVDDFYFSQKFKEVIACEQQRELASIHAHNANVLGLKNSKILAVNGVDFLQQTAQNFDLIYADPARRGTTSKVFQLADCDPDITKISDLLLKKGNKVLIKTAPLLDITHALKTLPKVRTLYIVSVKNECKELLWVLEKHFTGTPKIVCVTLNEQQKSFDFIWGEEKTTPAITNQLPDGFLYEPDAALLKSGAFNLIGNLFGLEKLHFHTHLYSSKTLKTDFPGRIFKIDASFTIGAFKKLKNTEGNVITRNYPEKPEALVKSYKIAPSKEKFLLFTTVGEYGKYVFQCTIQQYY